MGDAADSNKTDNSKLIATDTVYVSPDGGTTNEPFPAPNVEYDFCVDVANTGQLPSGPFFVRFTLSGDQDPPINLDFTQDAGLDAAASVKAVVHFGTFANQFATYQLDACIYSPSAPEKPINCAGSFGITINTVDSATNNSATDNSATGNSATDNSATDNSATDNS
jgi:hypothetical protein